MTGWRDPLQPSVAVRAGAGHGSWAAGVWVRQLRDPGLGVSRRRHVARTLHLPRAGRRGGPLQPPQQRVAHPPQPRPRTHRPPEQ